MIVAILLLWLALLFLLVRACIRAFKHRRTFEGAVILVCIVLLLFFTGEYALFGAWSFACEAGLPLSCRM